MRNKPDVLVNCVSDILKMLEENKIHPHVGTVFPLSEVWQSIFYLSTFLFTFHGKWLKPAVALWRCGKKFASAKIFLNARHWSSLTGLYIQLVKNTTCKMMKCK